MKSFILTLVSLSALLGTCPAFAIVTRNCPQTIHVEFSEPQIKAEYAIVPYESLFADINKVEEELVLTRTRYADCTYEPLARYTDIYKVVLKGTFRKGSHNPATMVTYMVLPIDGDNGEDIGDAIVYSRLSKVTPQGIGLKRQASKIFYQSANCEEGPCVVTHIPVGTYKKARAK